MRRNKEESTRTMPATGLCALQWDEALAIASLRIQRLIHYDAIVFYGCDDTLVDAKYTGGDARAGLEGLAVPRGEGLVGWVADVGKPILNGNPAVEPGYAGSDRSPGLASAMALPLVSGGRVVGVLALYRKEKDAFAADELVSLLEICPSLAALMLETTETPTQLSNMAAAVEQDSASLANA